MGLRSARYTKAQWQCSTFAQDPLRTHSFPPLVAERPGSTGRPVGSRQPHSAPPKISCIPDEARSR